MNQHHYFFYTLFFATLTLLASCSSTNKTQTKEPVTIELTNGNRPASNDSTYIVEKYVQPEIVGGIQKLQDDVQYPKEAKERNIEGIVRIGVMVKKDGEIGEIKIVQSPHPLLSRAAKKAVRKAEFIPGKQDGKPADVYMTFPLIFRLQ